MGKFPDAIHGRTVPNELSPKTDIEAEVVPRCQFVANIGTWAIQHGADGCGRLISNHDAHMHNLVVHQTFWYVRSKIGRVNQRQPSKQPNHDHQETQNQKTWLDRSIWFWMQPISGVSGDYVGAMYLLWSHTIQTRIVMKMSAIRATRKHPLTTTSW